MPGFPADDLFPSDGLYPGGGVATKRVLTPRAEEMLDRIPPYFQGSYYIQGAMLAQANEVDRIETYIEGIVNAFFPQLSGPYVSIWEKTLEIAVEPAGLTIAQRQLRVLAAIIASRNDSSGAVWVQNVASILGAGWTYSRWTPPSGVNPPQNTIKIKLPTGGAYNLEELRRLIARFTPANTEIEFETGEGFVVEQSLIQEQPL